MTLARDWLRPHKYPHYAAALMERALLLHQWHSDRPQVFILGLPRSGTTLIYQYIVHRLHVAYFTQGDRLNRQHPCVSALLDHWRYGDYQSDFESHYGKNKGAGAPHEAGGFWARFFDLDSYADYDELSNAQINTLRNSVFCAQRLYGDTPFVNKNVKYLLRILPLSQIFPQAIFLVVERDLQAVALSVLRGRYQNLNNVNEWWSVRPPDYDQIKDLEPAAQVAQQVISLKQRLDHDLKQIEPARVLKIDYQDFCTEPENLITQLQTCIGPVREKNPLEVAFALSTKLPQTDEEKILLQKLKTLKKVGPDESV